MKKLTIEYIREQTEKTGYKMLSDEYINTKTKLEFQCPEGHIFWMRWSNFQRGQRCPVCSVESKKLTIEFIREQTEKTGYKMLSDAYKNARTKLEFQCPEGHIFWMTWASFQQGSRCPVCNGKQKLTIEYIREHTEKTGYKMLSEEYKNALTKLEFQCPEGHIFWMTWASFQQGQRCPVCNGKQKLTIEYIREYTERQGYELLSKKYVSAQTKYEFQCPEGHIFWMTWANFRQGHRCPECFGTQKLTIEFVREQTEKTGYKMLSEEYVNSQTKLKFQCPEGHIFWMTWANFQQGQRCPECANCGTSKAEQEIQKFVHSKISLFDDIIFNDRTQILNPKTGYYLELDVYLPSLNKAIEYNGTYWHSKQQQKVKDKFKVKECEKLGIDLLVIHEEDYINNKEQELQKITEFLKDV